MPLMADTPFPRHIDREEVVEAFMYRERPCVIAGPPLSFVRGSRLREMPSMKRLVDRHYRAYVTTALESDFEDNVALEELGAVSFVQDGWIGFDTSQGFYDGKVTASNVADYLREFADAVIETENQTLP